MGTPRADEALAEFRSRLGPIPTSSFHYHHARLIDTLHCLEKLEALRRLVGVLRHHVVVLLVKMRGRLVQGLSQAADLLGELGDFAPDVRRLVLDHHERLDGSGYPRGRRAEALRTLPRIIAVCDVYDALVSRRTYKEPWDDWQVLDTIRAGAGTQFDPTIVKVFFSIYEVIKAIRMRYAEDESSLG